MCPAQTLPKLPDGTVKVLVEGQQRALVGPIEDAETHFSATVTPVDAGADDHRPSEIAALPPEHQAALRTQFGMLDAMQRQGWRLGPDLGADWPRLQPLFAYVPPAEREGLLSVLRRLDAEQRDDLAALAQRLPPQDRDAFRRELLAVPDGRRRAWLQQRRER